MRRIITPSAICRSISRGCDHRASAPPKPPEMRPATGLRSSAPPSVSTSTRPTRAASRPHCMRGSRAAPRPTPTACSRSRSCGATSLRSAERSLTLARASRFAPSFQFGVDKGDPSSPNPNQLLPVIGFSLPLPLLNWSGGEVTRAIAERDRANAELDLTRRETDAAVSRARRELVAARDRLRRSAALVASADRVAAMSLRAYGEGAIALANVLEAQRNAREILARYIDDLAAADAAARTLRWLTTSPEEP